MCADTCCSEHLCLCACGKKRRFCVAFACEEAELKEETPCQDLQAQGGWANVRECVRAWMCVRACVCARTCLLSLFTVFFLSLWVLVDVGEGCRVPFPRCFGFITRSVSAASLGVFFLRNSTFFFVFVCFQSSKVICLIFFFFCLKITR